MRTHGCSVIVLSLLACLATAGGPALAADDGPLVYNRDIRPILSDNCFACHGNDKNHVKGKLRLNDRDAAISRKAIVPGKPDESEMIARIISNDPDDIMPPPDSHKVLTPAQKDLIKRWVAEGAVYQPHWAYIVPAQPPLPAVKNAQWAANPIDRFVLAELERRKLQPAQAADKATLIRRVTLDLTGLPPTPEDVSAFVNDPAPDAYEKLVDRLLASPRFGERMAAPWLDAVRFSDTVGYHGDQNQRIFPYRDYVINSFNSNKPFDRFTIEQLAGDLLPNATTEQLVASGFNRLNMMTREGGAQPKEYVAKYQADRVRTVGLAWLGSTFGCAECHDHKFDPISMKDFYGMSAFFADIRQWGVYSDYGYTPNPDLKGWSNDHPFPPEILVDSPYLKARQATLEQQLELEIGAAVEKTFADAAAKKNFDSWLEETRAFLKANPNGWQTPPASLTLPAAAPATPAKAKAAAPTTKPTARVLTPNADGYLTIKPAEKGKTNDVVLRPEAGWVAAIKLEASGDPAMSTLNNGSQRQGIRLSATVRPAKGAVRRAGVYHAEADFKEPRYSSTEELIGVKDGWKLSNRQLKQAQSSVWLLDPPLRVDQGDQLIVSLSGDTTVPVRLSISPLSDWNPLKVAEADMLRACQVDAAQRTRQQAAKLYTGYLVSTGVNAEAFARFKVLQRQILECRDGKAWTQVTVAQKPMVTRVLPRGNWQDETGDVLQPQTPHFLPQPADAQGRTLNRLDLANWLVSAENPLTSRVIVNRYWRLFFGNGLCASIEDFGLQGEWPSHPDLLDWLAVEFRKPSLGGAAWDTKRIIRLIVTSNTYRQSSTLPAALRESDPQGRLLASQMPRRLDAEFVRDNALFAAGLLNVADIGGPSVKPYQPDGYYAPLQFPDRPYRPETDDRQYRRGVYMHWQRTFLHPMLANFDAPSREDAICARVQSNTPQQALTLLNDPSFVEASRVMAADLLKAPGTDGQRIARIYARTLARQPKPAELASLTKFVAAQRELYKAAPDEAQKLLAVGIAPVPQGDVAELAAWTNTCRVVLNLHETITRY
jgi:mono/diheme cytochrome c family protein